MPDGGYNNPKSSPKKGAMNLAPLEPLRALRDEAKKPHEVSSLAQMIKEFHDQIKSEGLEERQQIAESGRWVSNIRSGKLDLKRSPVHGGLTLVKRLPHRDRQDKHIYPIAQTNSSQLTSTWTLSRPRAVPRHFGDSPKAQIQHGIIEQMLQHYDKQCFDEWFHQAESLSMMDYGTAVLRIFYDDHLNPIKHLIPILEDRERTIFEGYQFCQACQKEGTPNDFELKGEMRPRCPDCGSYQVSDPLAPQTVTASEVVGEREVQQGDIGVEMLQVPACNWDMRKLPQLSSYFAHRTEIPLHIAETILGIDLPEAADMDNGIAVLNEIGSRGGSIAGWGREDTHGHSTRRRAVTLMDEEHYDTTFYAGKKLTKEEVTVSGEVIPAGVDLAEVFPDGISVVGFNDMQVIAKLENAKRFVYGGVYHIQSNSGVGQGVQAAVEVAEQLNEAHSANLAMLKRYGAGGGYWYDSDVMSAKQAKELMKPGGLVGFSMRGTNYQSVEGALQQIKHGELSNSNLALVAQLSNLMNIAFQSTEFTSGVLNENVDINTARGQELLAAQNQQRAAAPLRMKGWLRAQVGEGIIEKYRECQHAPRFIGSADKFSMTKGRWIAGSELPEKVYCDFVANSEIPTNQYLQQQAAQNMLEKSQFFGVPFVQLAQMDPRKAAWWATLHGVDMPLFNESDLLTVCQDRVENLKQLADEAEQMAQLSGARPDPAQVAQQMVQMLRRRVFTFEENHVIKAQLLGEYLDDDEALEWNDYMKAGIEALIDAHYTADRDARGNVAMKENELQTAMMAEQARAQAQVQAELAAQQAQGQAQANAEAEARAMEQEQAKMTVEMAAAEEEWQRQEESAENEFRRDRMAAAEDYVREKESAKVQMAHETKLKEKDVAARRAAASRAGRPGGGSR